MPELCDFQVLKYDAPDLSGNAGAKHERGALRAQGMHDIDFYIAGSGKIPPSVRSRDDCELKGHHEKHILDAHNMPRPAEDVYEEYCFPLVVSDIFRDDSISLITILAFDSCASDLNQP